MFPFLAVISVNEPLFPYSTLPFHLYPPPTSLHRSVNPPPFFYAVRSFYSDRSKKCITETSMTIGKNRFGDWRMPKISFWKQRPSPKTNQTAVISEISALVSHVIICAKTIPKAV